MKTPSQRTVKYPRVRSSVYMSPATERASVIDTSNGAPMGRRVSRGHRAGACSGEVTELLNDYIEVPRYGVTGTRGWELLFSTRHGRATRTTIRKNFYAITRPGEVTENCLHDRYRGVRHGLWKKEASQRPSSRSPHPVRRSVITHHLNRDWPAEKSVNERT